METSSPLAEYQTDHDLLVVLNERVGALTVAVDRKNNDHEERIRTLETEIDGQVAASTLWRYVVGITLPIVFIALGWIFVQFYTLESTLDKRISTAITTSLTNYSLIKN